MPQEISYASYLLRIWREGDEPEAWQGEIESIQSGQKWRFVDLESLFDLLEIQMRAAAANRPVQNDD